MDLASKRPYTDLVYQPMLEAMEYLRANGSQRVYCIPPSEGLARGSGSDYGPRRTDGPRVRLPDVDADDQGVTARRGHGPQRHGHSVLRADFRTRSLQIFYPW